MPLSVSCSRPGPVVVKRDLVPHRWRKRRQEGRGQRRPPGGCDEAAFDPLDGGAPTRGRPNTVMPVAAARATANGHRRQL